MDWTWIGRDWAWKNSSLWRKKMNPCPIHEDFFPKKLIHVQSRNRIFFQTKSMYSTWQKKYLILVSIQVGLKKICWPQSLYSLVRFFSPRANPCPVYVGEKIFLTPVPIQVENFFHSRSSLDQSLVNFFFLTPVPIQSLRGPRWPMYMYIVHDYKVPFELTSQVWLKSHQYDEN